MPEKIPMEILFSPQFGADPYALYTDLREKGPVHPIDFPPGTNSFLVIDYAHGRAALADPRMSKDMRNAGEWFRARAAEDKILFGTSLLTSDPPDHTRLRRLVSKAFTPRRVEDLRPRVQEITDELINAMTSKGEADLIEEFAFPLPIIVICELLGIPAEDRESFREWSTLLITPDLTEEIHRRRKQAGNDMWDYFRRMIAARRAQPEGDLISALLVARDEDGLLTEDELLSLLSLLLIAGHETTVNLIGNGMAALLRHPDQLALLRDRPDLLPPAIEEFLRYDGPVERSSIRIAMEDLEIAGTPIPKGSMVHVSLGAAGRDPDGLADPNRLDITREDSRHVAFGHGIHFCLGAPLARLEGQIAFGSLLSRLPGIELACPPDRLTWKQTGSIVRGLTTLPVRW
ncbi:cytochrome P450 [Planotetraspora sp. GP83]|uniref:cytochrome P450 family protein n=1 Tax=Planotetraspora sp. GP83 TaxID=3156264 RepID=UPI00351589A1